MQKSLYSGFDEKVLRESRGEIDINHTPKCLSAIDLVELSAGENVKGLQVTDLASCSSEEAELVSDPQH